MVNPGHINLIFAKRHISLLSNFWPTLFPQALMEIRCIKQGKSVPIKFLPSRCDELNDALKNAAEFNAIEYEIYCTVNPSNHLNAKSVSDEHILGSKFNFADADSQESYDSLLQKAPKPDFVVVTGTVPFHRAHFYWELANPESDFTRWTNLQRKIAEHHNADETISNPSRIMRLAGFMTYPSLNKISRGYISELVSLVENSQ